MKETNVVVRHHHKKIKTVLSSPLLSPPTHPLVPDPLLPSMYQSERKREDEKGEERREISLSFTFWFWGTTSVFCDAVPEKWTRMILSLSSSKKELERHAKNRQKFLLLFRPFFSLISLDEWNWWWRPTSLKDLLNGSCETVNFSPPIKTKNNNNNRKNQERKRKHFMRAQKSSRKIRIVHCDREKDEEEIVRIAKLCSKFVRPPHSPSLLSLLPSINHVRKEK